MEYIWFWFTLMMFMCESINIIKDTDALIVATKGSGLKANPDKSKPVLKPRKQNAA